MGWLLVLALALMLGMGPFLHAHLGGSSVTGFHLDAASLPSATLTLEGRGGQAVLTAAHENESPAVGVASGYPSRDSQTPEVPDASAFWLLVFFLGGLLLACAADLSKAWSLPARQRGFECPGLPPPAQAPPL